MTNASLSHDGSRIEPRFGETPAVDISRETPMSPTLPPAMPPARRTGWRLLVAAAALAVAAGAITLWLRGPVPMPPPQAAARPPAASTPAEAPAIRHPIEQVAPPDTTPLPTLAQSDGPLAEALTALWGRASVDRWLVTQDIVRHVVATVDNLPRRTYAQRLSPVKPVPGTYTAGKSGDHLGVPASQARYTPLVEAFVAVDAKKLVALYVRYYPLFQQEYRELGYPSGYFNDRLVEALDVLLAAPETTGSLALVQPKVVYEFADPALEALPAGQKVLLRLGPDNARRVKAKLREIRKLVAAEKP